METIKPLKSTIESNQNKSSFVLKPVLFQQFYFIKYKKWYGGRCTFNAFATEIEKRKQFKILLKKV